VLNRPIGIIDSGVGGLTVAYEVMRQLPKENFIYLGDTLRCPYGSKNKDEIFEYTLEMVEFMLKKDIKLLIIACNTATAYTLEYLQENINIPIIGVIKPGARAAIKTTIKNNVGVIATEATINSNAYKKTLEKINPDIFVINKACPDFVPMIEAGFIKGSKTERIVESTLSSLNNEKIDTLILGCTHYPLIKEVIQKKMNKKIKIISSGEETAREASAILEYYGLINQSTHNPTYNFYTTGNSMFFSNLANNLFKQSLNSVESIVIENVKI